MTTKSDKARVTIASINPGLVAHEFTTSLLGICSSRNRSTRPSNVILQRSGALIQLTRNEVTERFINQTKDDWLLWIDSDIEFPPNLIDLLLETSAEAQSMIVGGMYIHPMPERMKPSAFFYRTNEHGKYMDALQMEDINSFREQGMKWIFVDGTGAGCMLIHRQALLAMYETASRIKDLEPWFTCRVINGVFYGEDLAFCHRARELGMKIAVRFDIPLGHVKAVIYKTDSPQVI